MGKRRKKNYAKQLFHHQTSITHNNNDHHNKNLPLQFLNHDKLRQEAKQYKQKSCDFDEIISSSEASKHSQYTNSQIQKSTCFIGNLQYQVTAVKIVESLAKFIGSVLYTDYKDKDCINALTFALATFGLSTFDLSSFNETTFPIVKCFIPNPPKVGKPYFAFVTFANEQIKESLLSSSTNVPIYIMGRKINLRDATFKSYHDPTGLRCQIDGVQLGAPILFYLSRFQQKSYLKRYIDNCHDHDNYSNNDQRNNHFHQSTIHQEPWYYHWDSNDQLYTSYMEVNGLSKVIAFEFSSSLLDHDFYRVEISMNHLEGGIRIEEMNPTNNNDGINSTFLIFIVKVPPAIYRLDKTKSESNNRAYLQSSTASIPILIDGIQNDRVWTLGSTSGNHDKNWIRTIDFSNGVFPTSTMYRIQLRSKSCKKIISHLERLHLLVQKMPRDRISNNVIPSRYKCKGWSGDEISDSLLEKLPFEIRYLIQCLVSQNRISLVNNPKDVEGILNIVNNHSSELVIWALTELEKNWVNLFYLHPVSVLNKWIEYGNNLQSLDLNKSSGRNVYVPMISITPLRIVCHAPQLSLYNRVLRMYENLHSRLMRVTFTDESFGSFYNAKSEDILRLRMKSTLENGILIANRRYKFLAYSNSQLRSISCWVYDDRPMTLHGITQRVPTVEELRSSLGNFSPLKNMPSRFGARLGQCFSDIIDSTSLSHLQWRVDSDIEWNGFCFSDGVGKISKKLASEISKQMGFHTTIPSAFQIRYAGFKGVLTTWELPSDRGHDEIHCIFRPSMKKFESQHQSLEVITTSNFIPVYLNRQLIILLSGLGVSNDVFISLQQDMITDVEHITSDRSSALELIRLIYSNDKESSWMNVAHDLLEAGFDPQSNYFLSSILEVLKEHLLRQMLDKSRILIKNGVALIGVIDETKTLKPGTVFVQYQRKSMSAPTIVTNDVIVGRNPSLHPGDIRRLKAVDVSSLHHLVNVIVFPGTQSDRPLQSMMSGGDLDGDIYFCIWDEKLIPCRSALPMCHDTSLSTDIDVVEASDITDWFVKYVENDQLGVIATSHLIYADLKPDGCFSKECLKLAELHSIAVDFGKTGKPATIPKEIPIPKAYPDFLQNLSHPQYESKSVLGVLWRALKGTTTEASLFLSSPKDMEFIDKPDDDLLHPDYPIFINEALHTKWKYESRLWSIMSQYGIMEESEVCTGCINSFYKSGHELNLSRQNAEKTIARIRMSFQKLWYEFRDLFWEELNHYFKECNVPKNQENMFVFAKASAWYVSTFDYEDEESDGTLSSFGYVMHELLCKMKMMKTSLNISDC